jgi:hypothetical protein
MPALAGFDTQTTPAIRIVPVQLFMIVPQTLLIFPGAKIHWPKKLLQQKPSPQLCGPRGTDAIETP